MLRETIILDHILEIILGALCQSMKIIPCCKKPAS